MVSYPRRSTKPHTIDEIAGGSAVPIDEVSSLAVPIDKIPMLSYVRGCLQPASFAVLSNTAAILIASEIDAFKRTSTDQTCYNRLGFAHDSLNRQAVLDFFDHVSQRLALLIDTRSLSTCQCLSRPGVQSSSVTGPCSIYSTHALNPDPTQRLPLRMSRIPPPCGRCSQSTARPWGRPSEALGWPGGKPGGMRRQLAARSHHPPRVAAL